MALLESLTDTHKAIGKGGAATLATLALAFQIERSVRATEALNATLERQEVARQQDAFVERTGHKDVATVHEVHQTKAFPDCVAGHHRAQSLANSKEAVRLR